MENYGKFNKSVGWNKRVGRKVLKNIIKVLVENFLKIITKVKKKLKFISNIEFFKQLKLELTIFRKFL